MEEIDDLKKGLKDISLVAFEAVQARDERKEKRHTLCHLVIEILLILALIGSNFYWVYNSQKYEKVTEEYEVEQDTSSGSNTFVGGDMNG